jgi:hypothetical protein
MLFHHLSNYSCLKPYMTFIRFYRIRIVQSGHIKINIFNMIAHSPYLQPIYLCTTDSKITECFKYLIVSTILQLFVHTTGFLHNLQRWFGSRDLFRQRPLRPDWLIIPETSGSCFVPHGTLSIGQTTSISVIN